MLTNVAVRWVFDRNVSDKDDIADPCGASYVGKIAFEDEVPFFVFGVYLDVPRNVEALDELGIRELVFVKSYFSAPRESVVTRVCAFFCQL